MIGDAAIQSEPAKPAIGLIEANLFAKPALGPNARAVDNNQHAKGCGSGRPTSCVYSRRACRRRGTRRRSRGLLVRSSRPPRRGQMRVVRGGKLGARRGVGDRAAIEHDRLIGEWKGSSTDGSTMIMDRPRGPSSRKAANNSSTMIGASPSSVGLVEQQKARVEDQRAADGQHLLLPVSRSGAVLVAGSCRAGSSKCWPSAARWS